MSNDTTINNVYPKLTIGIANTIDDLYKETNTYKNITKYIDGFTLKHGIRETTSLALALTNKFIATETYTNRNTLPFNEGGDLDISDKLLKLDVELPVTNDTYYDTLRLPGYYRLRYYEKINELFLNQKLPKDYDFHIIIHWNDRGYTGGSLMDNQILDSKYGTLTLSPQIGHQVIEYILRDKYNNNANSEVTAYLLTYKFHIKPKTQDVWPASFETIYIFGHNQTSNEDGFIKVIYSTGFDNNTNKQTAELTVTIKSSEYGGTWQWDLGNDKALELLTTPLEKEHTLTIFVRYISAEQRYYVNIDLDDGWWHAEGYTNIPISHISNCNKEQFSYALATVDIRGHEQLYFYQKYFNVIGFTDTELQGLSNTIKLNLFTGRVESIDYNTTEGYSNINININAYDLKQNYTKAYTDSFKEQLFCDYKPRITLHNLLDILTNRDSLGGSNNIDGLGNGIHSILYYIFAYNTGDLSYVIDTYDNYMLNNGWIPLDDNTYTPLTKVYIPNYKPHRGKQIYQCLDELTNYCNADWDIIQYYNAIARSNLIPANVWRNHLRIIDLTNLPTITINPIHTDVVNLKRTGIYKSEKITDKNGILEYPEPDESVSIPSVYPTDIIKTPTSKSSDEELIDYTDIESTLHYEYDNKYTNPTKTEGKFSIICDYNPAKYIPLCKPYWKFQFAYDSVSAPAISNIFKSTSTPIPIKRTTLTYTTKPGSKCIWKLDIEPDLGMIQLGRQYYSTNLNPQVELRTTTNIETGYKDTAPTRILHGFCKIADIPSMPGYLSKNVSNLRYPAITVSNPTIDSYITKFIIDYDSIDTLYYTYNGTTYTYDIWLDEAHTQKYGTGSNNGGIFTIYKIDSSGNKIVLIGEIRHSQLITTNFYGTITFNTDISGGKFLWT